VIIKDPAVRPKEHGVPRPGDPIWCRPAPLLLEPAFNFAGAESDGPGRSA
jgi:hypothetical protein